MRQFIGTTFLVLAAGYSISTFSAPDPKEQAIKARQADMTLRGFNAGPLFAMAKGDIPYDAAMASKLANNLKTLMGVDIGHAWVPGTDNESYPGVSEALPALWEDMDEVRERGKAYADAVNNISGTAGNGIDALRAGVRDLGKACKGCHDDFREDD